MKLGLLISALTHCSDNESSVYFDFGGFSPSKLISYRGDYRQLALGFDRHCIIVGELLKICKEANGKIFTGYKGGDYKMDLNTEIWIANYSETSNTIIRDVRNLGCYVIIETRWREG